MEESEFNSGSCLKEDSAAKNNEVKELLPSRAGSTI